MNKHHNEYVIEWNTSEASFFVSAPMHVVLNGSAAFANQYWNKKVCRVMSVYVVGLDAVVCRNNLTFYTSVIQLLEINEWKLED